MFSLNRSGHGRVPGNCPCGSVVTEGYRIHAASKRTPKGRDAGGFWCPRLRGTPRCWLIQFKSPGASRSDTDALRGRRGLWPVPVVPTVCSGTTSRFPSRREKSHVHKCPLVPKHKSCLSINCWRWITASGRAHPKTEIVTGSDNRHCGAWPGRTSTL